MTSEEHAEIKRLKRVVADDNARRNSPGLQVWENHLSVVRVDESVVELVAHHSCASVEAYERGAAHVPHAESPHEPTPNLIQTTCYTGRATLCPVQWTVPGMKSWPAARTEARLQDLGL